MGVQKISKGRVVAGQLDQGVGARALRLQVTSLATTGPFATGLKVPPNSRILDAVLVMNSQASMATPLVDLGVTASAAFLLSGVNVDSAGVKQGSLIAGAVTVGTGLLEGAAASGGFTRKPFVTPASGETEITLSPRTLPSRFDGTVVVQFEKL
jgi:hypothetical protein